MDTVRISNIKLEEGSKKQHRMLNKYNHEKEIADEIICYFFYSLIVFPAKFVFGLSLMVSCFVKLHFTL
mgnify:CR=1 FL=1